MLRTFRASRSNVVVWVILVLLMIGLAGFGISTGGRPGRTVAEVGDVRVDAETYTLALEQELRALSQQIGRQLPMSEARQFGVDRMVLGRLVSDAALDREAEALGLSTGDGTVQEMVLANPAFQGAGGSFDRQAYSFALERAGLSPAGFEAMLRAEATRELVAGAVQAAATTPAALGDRILGYIGEQRRIDWLELDVSHLKTPTPRPDEATLRAFYDANVAARYTAAEARRITYAVLEPETLAATIVVPEEDLRAAYEAAGERFNTPERRIADRIGFASLDEAVTARARIEADEITFDALATERGLRPEDLDQGELRRADLAAAAGEAIFGAAEPGLVGPVETPLGPSLYRVNAVLAPVSTPFGAAREELQRERALALARERVAEKGAAVADLVAGGARIEEIVAETDFVQGTITLDSGSSGGLADDPAFRESAMSAEANEETDPVELGSGGLAILRVDAVDPPAPVPFEDIRAQVEDDWIAEENVRRLGAMANGLRDELEGGLRFADLGARLGRAPETAGPMRRTDLLPEAPAGLVEAAFSVPAGSVAVTGTQGRVALVQVAQVTAFDPSGAEVAPLVNGVREQLRAGAAEDTLTLFLQAVQSQTGVTVDQPLIDQILVQFP